MEFFPSRKTIFFVAIHTGDQLNLLQHNSNPLTPPLRHLGDKL